MSEQSLILQDGIETLSNHQTVVFTKYTKAMVYGYDFLVKTEDTKTIQGSWHEAVNQEMREDQNIAVASVSFTTQQLVEEFEAQSNTDVWVADYRGFLWSPTRRGKYYVQAATFHYYGDAVFPLFKRLFVDALVDLDAINPIASNSMTLWLGLDFGSFTAYPSFLSPTNLQAPYISVHVIDSESNLAMQNASAGNYIDNRTDKIRLTIYGADAYDAADIQNVINENTVFGLLNRAQITDGDTVQSEINAKLPSKTLEITINYDLITPIRGYAEKPVLTCSIPLTTQI